MAGEKFAADEWEGENVDAAWEEGPAKGMEEGLGRPASQPINRNN